MTTENYTAEDIKILTDNQHVRLRNSIYFGSGHPTSFNIPLLSGSVLRTETVTFIPAVYKAIGEIIDNSVDEFTQISSKNKILKINADTKLGQYSISDTGRGVPIDLHSSGKYTPEVVFGSLRSGRNFTDDKKSGIIGQNGVGSSCTNYCSSVFEVTIHRDNKKYYQKFENGAEVINPPEITPLKSKTTGTEISFQLDNVVFSDISLPDSLMRNRAIEIAMTNPGITVEFNKEKFKFDKGLKEIIEKKLHGQTYYCISIDEGNIQGELFIVFDAHSSQDEQMFTWVNSSLLFDGGKCNTQFFNAFFDRVGTHLEKEAKKTKTEITRNDIRQGLLVLANFKIKNPEYDSQSKTRLTGPDLRKEFVSSVDSVWKPLSKVANEWLAQVLERANERHHKQANKKAQDDHEKKKRKKVEGLLDATSKNRLLCNILVTEGFSARANVSEARNPVTTAAFALTGKINNTYGCTVAQVLAMGKLTDLLSAIGLTPGKRANRSLLHFGNKIVIASDSDYDGDHIFTLLVNLFYQFWPELFNPKLPPIIYRLIAPNVVVSKGNKRIHFANRTEYEESKNKYNGWNVEYMKGLGSLSKADWETILNEDNDCFIPVIDDGDLQDVLHLSFGPSADDRKDWLTSNEEYNV